MIFSHPQAAAVSGADAPLVEIAFQYGKNLGLAFQFVDDLLDFVSSSETMGKPAAADLKLGLATAPVLFACEKVTKYITNPMSKKKNGKDDFRFHVFMFLLIFCTCLDEGKKYIFLLVH